MIEHAETFVKALSANDVGDTGAHQAGVHIPRVRALLAFFPTLNPEEINPRELVSFVDARSGDKWEFTFIYYNGRVTGHSTRDEYRLTGMTQYLRSNSAQAGDFVELSRSVDGVRYISVVPRLSASNSSPVIQLSGTWASRTVA